MVETARQQHWGIVWTFDQRSLLYGPSGSFPIQGQQTYEDVEYEFEGRKGRLTIVLE